MDRCRRLRSLILLRNEIFVGVFICLMITFQPCAHATTEILNETPFGGIIRGCENLLNTVLPVDLSGLSENQSRIISTNLLSKADLNSEGLKGPRPHWFQGLYAVDRVPGRYFRGLQIPPSALKRILSDGIPYLDWRRPSEGLYVTDRIHMAFAHAMLPNHGGYSKNFLGVLLTIEPPPSEHWMEGEKIRVRDIAPGWITKVQLVNADYLKGASDQPLVDLPTTNVRGSSSNDE
jgi:hypothetical protein